MAKADPTPAPVTGVLHYTINIEQFQDDGVLPAGVLGPTTLRGFNPTRLLAGQNQRHLGGILVAHKGQPIQITFKNNLPAGKHIIPNDLTIAGASDGNNRTSVHFHGGLTPWVTDGGPCAWWDPTGRLGVSFLNNKVFNPKAAANEAEYYYPLNQSARLGWYHDHAMGITRINAYAGIASALIIRDSFEASLIKKGLPDLLEAGGREIPLVFEDTVFVGTDMATQDPTWSSVSSATTPGSLWYAHIYDPDRWQLNPGTAPPDPSNIPEFFGDTMLVNGTAYPTVTVEPRRYRLRLLNACNARFLNLQLYVADGSANGITLDANGVPTNTRALCDPGTISGASLLQIGTEGGFLPKPARIPTGVPFNAALPLSSSLVVAPAERPDLLVDFRLHPGKDIILYNDAPAPFPSGDAANDYFPGLSNGNPVNAATPAGFGPNSRVLMRFELAATASAPKDPPLLIDATTNLAQGIVPPLPAKGKPVRGASATIAAMLTQAVTYTGPATEPEPNEIGWKETVMMLPGTATRIIMRFDLPEIRTARGGVPMPVSPRTGGNEYVWHCHILEHEEHDMMRPLVVVKGHK